MADTASSGRTCAASTGKRVEKAGQILDKLDICRRLIELYPVDSRLALARQLLGCVADDIAELAGIEDEDSPEAREHAAILRAAQPLPKLAEPRRWLNSVEQALAFGAIAALVFGVVAVLLANTVLRWWL